MSVSAMNAAFVLRRARERISDPKHWTRHWVARSESGERCEARDPKAVSWCARGALAAELAAEMASGTPPRGTWGTWDFLEGAAREQAPRAEDPIVRVNDYKDHAAVLRAYDRAIELAEAEADG